MNTKSAGKALPIILAAITLATAIFFYKQREVLRNKTQELLNKSDKQVSLKLPEPTPFVPATRNPIVVPTVTSTPTPTIGQPQRLSKGSSTEIICTPVYGMANSCAEHTVVDTALDTSLFYNLAGLSYLAGLAAFIKAKKRA